MNLLILAWSGSFNDYLRTLMPTIYKPNTDLSIKMVVHKVQTLEDKDLNDANVILFNNLPPESLKRLTEARTVSGGRIIMDLDQHWELGAKHPQYGTWNDVGRHEVIKFMKEVDVVTTTNSRMANEIQRYNKNVYILPTCFPLGKDQFVPGEKSTDGKVRFIYTGGCVHYADLESIEYVLSDLKQNQVTCDKFEIVLANYTESAKNSTKALDVLSGSGSVATREILPLSKYMNVYDGTDVVIAPVVDMKYNSYRSNNILLEAGCKKMPLIARKMYPYLDDEIMNHKGIILCDHYGEWLNAFKFFIKNPNAIQDYGEKLHEYVKKTYDFQEINSERFNLIKDICLTTV